MTKLNEHALKQLLINTNYPIILKGYVNDWDICQWTLEQWCATFGSKEVPFRVMKKDFISDEPCWERRCNIKNSTFQDFLDISSTNDNWMYFDYKYLHKWFPPDSELIRNISWKEFGYPEKCATDTTLWVGSAGAHTPAHQDSYGFNIVAQLHGRKRWLLFSPETGGMKPTRVPYEESSIYSELNFYCPLSFENFKSLSGCRVVELEAGDALLVPRGWWHYVQNMDALNIALNVWIPHEEDDSTRVSEAITRILVAQICKDLPEETIKLVVNPNEENLGDTPLTVLFLQLEAVAKEFLDKRRKLRRIKRRRTCDESVESTSTEDIDFNAIIKDSANNIKMAQIITSEELINILRSNIKEYANEERLIDDEDVDGSSSSLGLTKALIDALSESNVIEQVKQNLLARLS